MYLVPPLAFIRKTLSKSSNLQLDRSQTTEAARHKNMAQGRVVRKPVNVNPGLKVN